MMDNLKNVNVLGIFILIIGLVCAKQNEFNCGGLATVGYTYPAGDITLEYGEPLNLTCILYNNTKEDETDPSQHLFFIKNNETEPLPKEMIDIVNSTAIRLYINRPAKRSDDNFMCYYKDTSKMVCMNVITVGVKPQNVTDFKCVGQNYDNLTCSWTPPNNYIKTEYSLLFQVKGRTPTATGRCPNMTEDKSKLSCVWTMSTTPVYRSAHPIIKFILNMKNPFGNQSLTYVFDHYKYVIPNPPQNLRATATSPHSVELYWELPSSMRSFPVGVHHRILYQCEYYEKKWQFGGLITDHPKKPNITFELTNLKYAHALCDIRVSIRSTKADPDDESAWSGNATRTVRTKSKIPDNPPETNIGSFEIVKKGITRDIYVYWKQVREEARNGENVVYKVEIKSPRQTSNITYFKSFLAIKNLPEAEYEITIWSQNDEGLSLEKSTMVIPQKPLPEPQRFVKIAHPDVFELLWNAPKTDKLITNYTIFWCPSEPDRSNECDGNVDWLTVPNDTVQHYLTLPKNLSYQIAIAANGINSSSGMVWADCMIISGKNVGKLRSVWISQVGSHYIDVEWKLECSDKIADVQGFIIYYCQIEKAQTACLDELRNVTIKNKNEQNGRVEQLKPYRTYLLMVSVIISNMTYSQPSEPMYNTTSEAAPSTPPLNIKITNMTESSLTVHWDSPLEINGILKYYEIYLNDTGKRVEANKNNFTISGLETYATYDVTMTACTVTCSRRSNKFPVITKMGVPGEISKPYISASNSTLITIAWSKPNPTRGKIDYYQLKFAYKISVTNQSDDIIVNWTSSQNYTTACDSKKSTFYVSVRAINVNGTEHKYGPWSEPLQINNCSSPSQLIYIFVVVMFIFVIAGVFFAFKKLYLYLQSMKDVQVKLPPGLQTAVEQPWVTTKHPEDINRMPKPDPDEELLLDKFPDFRLSVDAVSPKDTKTASVTSDTHETSDITQNNSLRQRNKSYNVPDLTKAAQTIGSYSVLGVDPSKSLNTETRYLPGLDGEQQSSPYVTVDNIVKLPNPGYIPFTATEPEDKNKGYVMAGMAKDLMGHDLLQCESQKPYEDTPLYVKASDTLSLQKGPQFHWEQPPPDSTLMKSGYVSVGDALPPKNICEASKGYVPHRQFDTTKSYKED